MAEAAADASRDPDPVRPDAVGAPFAPAWWLPGAHLQTIWPALLRAVPAVAARRQALELPDGDITYLDWVGPADGPIVIVLPGLQGGLGSPYVRGLLHALAAQGRRAVLLNHRGCGGTPNRLARSYHSGWTADLDFLVAHLRPLAVPLAAVGVSIGGNILLKWLGESGTTALTAACAVSVPCDLAGSARELDRGFAQTYQGHLVRSLRHDVARKLVSGDLGIGLDARILGGLDTFRRFDDRVTAPLHGFADVDDYYEQASSLPWLHRVRVPTLMLAARNDPFLSASCFPTPQLLSPAITWEPTSAGGHAGFVTGPPSTPRSWLEQRVCDFIDQTLGPAEGAKR
ncbi:MAG: hydrolase [Planctomycetes bacterium]|nr:hydrolase [Planctomycetota bacterium]